MRWALPVFLLSGCGRLAFDPLGDAAGSDAISGHDEDSDGVPDVSDVCPHLADPAQLDDDFDLVGNACDPEPSAAVQRWKFFSPLTGPDSRVAQFGEVWTVGSDDWSVVSPTGESNLVLTDSFVNVDVWAIIDVTDAAPANRQLPIIIQDSGSQPYYYGELIDPTGVSATARVTYFDGFSYNGTSPISYGAFPIGRTVTLHLAAREYSKSITYEVDAVRSSTSAPNYVGGMFVLVGIGNASGRVRCIAVIETSPPN